MYRDYATYIKEKFGMRAQKIALNPGFGCPNRDGSIGRGGCSYCCNASFSPYYGNQQLNIESQIKEGMSFFGRKYKASKFIAYFQSYTNTYAPTEDLRRIFSQAISHPDIAGLAVATRPDCAGNDVLDLLAEFSDKLYTTLEFGVESCSNKTLALINRGHTFEQAADAIERAAARGIEVCAHLIMYLPGESEDAMMGTAKIMSSLPVSILKLHQLQIIKGTPIEKQYNDHPWHLPTACEYASFCARYIKQCRPSMIWERFISESPRSMVAAPCWNGIRSSDFALMLRKALQDLE